MVVDLEVCAHQPRARHLPLRLARVKARGVEVLAKAPQRDLAQQPRGVGHRNLSLEAAVPQVAPVPQLERALPCAQPRELILNVRKKED